MCAVAVDAHAFDICAVHIAADMIATVDDKAGLARIGHFARKDAAEQARADDQVIILHGLHSCAYGFYDIIRDFE